MLFLVFILNLLGMSVAEAQMTPDPAIWSPPTTMEWIYDVHGKAYDVVNLYVHGSLEEIQSAFIQSGWTMAAKANGKNNFKYIGAVVFDGIDKGANFLVIGAEKTLGVLIHHPIHAKDIPNPVQTIINSMPVSSEVRDGNPSDFEFEMNNHPLGGREHFRVFNTHQVDPNQNPVWAISASRDIKIILDQSRPKQVFLNHEIEANEDLERDSLFQSLAHHLELAADVLQLKPLPPAAADGAYSADGRAYSLIFEPLSMMAAMPVMPAPVMPEVSLQAGISSGISVSP